MDDSVRLAPLTAFLHSSPLVSREVDAGNISPTVPTRPHVAELDEFIAQAVKGNAERVG